MLYSAIQQCKSAISICIYRQIDIYVSPLPLKPPSPSHPVPPLQVITECQAGLPMLYSSFHQLSTLHMTVSMSVLLSQFIPPSFSLLCPQIPSLHLCLYSCPANRFISTTSLGSIYMSLYMIFVFLFLTLLHAI